MHVFESPEEPCVVENKCLYQQYVETHLEFLDVYMTKLREFEHVLDYSIEKNLKKGSFEEYSKELDKLIAIRNDMEKYMFKRKIRIGVFYLDITAFQEKCGERLKSASDGLYKNLIQKIGKENQKIEDEIRKMIQQLTYEPKNLEEMHELRTYAREQLQLELLTISKKINKVMEKLTLMEKMNYEISYNDFAQTWKIYGMPLKLMRK